MKRCVYIILILVSVLLLASCSAATSPAPNYKDEVTMTPMAPALPDVGGDGITASPYDIFKFEWNEKYQGYFVYENEGNPYDYVVIPETYNGKAVVGIGQYAFGAYSKVKSVVIPSSIMVIEFQAFNYCDYLESVTFLNESQLEIIKENAFYNCKRLHSIFIPKNVKMIGNRAFSTCPALEKIEVDENNAYYSDIDGNLYSKDGKLLICITPTFMDALPPEEPKPDDNVDNISVPEITVPEGVVAIADNAFRDCDGIGRIYIPISVKSIGSTIIGQYVTEIVFAGTTEEWNAIKKETKWDEKAQDYVVICTNGTITKAE